MVISDDDVYCNFIHESRDNKFIITKIRHYGPSTNFLDQGSIASTTEEQDSTTSSTSEEQEVTTKQPSSETSNTFKYQSTIPYKWSMIIFDFK